MSAAAVNPAVHCPEFLKKSLENQLEVVSSYGDGGASLTTGKNKLAANASSVEDFEQRAQSVLSSLQRPHKDDSTRGVPTSANPQDGEPPAAFSIALLELVQVAAQLAQIDAMAGKAMEAAPEVPDGNDEARKWRDLSMCALEWSRGALAQRQAGAAERLERTMQVPASALSAPDAKHLAASTPEKVPNCAAEGPSTICAPPGLAPPPGLAFPPSDVGVVSPLPAVDDVFDDNTAGASPASPTEESSYSKQLGVEEFEKGGTLRTHLELMSGEDQSSILVVRRINRLGFQSPGLLEEYFKKFGGAKHVFVAHSRVKPSTKRPSYRIRPAGVGFIVMPSPEAADQVMAAESHEIQGCSIEMSFYKDNASELNLDIGDRDKEQVIEDNLSK